MTTGERIKALRLQHGMTMEELAGMLGLQKAAIYKYESGLVVNLKRDVVEKLSKIFDVSPSYIMCLDDEKPATDDGDELTELLERLKNRPECRMLFQLADNATAEDVRKAVAIIEALRREE